VTQISPAETESSRLKASELAGFQVYQRIRKNVRHHQPWLVQKLDIADLNLVIQQGKCQDSLF